MANNNISDLTGIGKIIDSEIAKESYNDAVSPALKEFGALTKDAVKTFRLFTAPVQLLAAYQDRFSNFCDRVRNKVPEEFQQPAPANIAKPVREITWTPTNLTQYFCLLLRMHDQRDTHSLK